MQYCVKIYLAMTIEIKIKLTIKVEARLSASLDNYFSQGHRNVFIMMTQNDSEVVKI